MRTTAQQSTEGKHRKVTTSQTLKGRIALVAVATGAVSSAGVGGAAAATLQAPAENPAASEATDVDVELANTTAALPSDAADPAPQILTVAEYKPVNNIDEQLATAVEYNTEQAQAHQATHTSAAAEPAADTAPSSAAQSTVGATGSAVAEPAATGSQVVKPAEGTFTSGYGMRWGSLHAGLDIANAVGTPILAAMGGTVIDSGPASGFGQWIRIQHDDGSIAVYGHMETLDVSVGQQVTAGQKIAGMGNRGYSTGSHLHFELYPSGTNPVDPAPWFAQYGITF